MSLRNNYMYKIFTKLLSKLWNIKFMEYYSTNKIIIMNTMNKQEKYLCYNVKRSELKYYVH